MNQTPVKEIAYYDNGMKRAEYYTLDGKFKFHRNDGPAVILWNNEGKKVVERYLKNGSKHRLDGPAVRNWHEEKIVCETYCVRGHMHREDGPAHIEYTLDGEINRKEYWLEGNKFTEKKFYRERIKRQLQERISET